MDMKSIYNDSQSAACHPAPSPYTSNFKRLPFTQSSPNIHNTKQIFPRHQHNTIKMQLTALLLPVLATLALAADSSYAIPFAFKHTSH